MKRCGNIELGNSTTSLLFLIIAALMVVSCASQQPPSGGPKDERAPRVVRAEPPQWATNVRGQVFRFTFDEFVTLNNPNAHIFFSPALERPLDFRLRGKTLRITISDTLRSNATYTVYLSNAVRDLSEGNLLADYRHVFSTGPTLDSMRIRGQVLLTPQIQPKAAMLVMLHAELSDSAIARRRPDYFARTDSTGSFDLNFLKAGTYRLVALDDANQNYLYDDPAESVAFLDTPIRVDDTSSFFSLMAFQALPKQKVLQTKVISPRSVQVVLARPYGNPVVTSLIDTQALVTWFNPSRDSLQIWSLQPTDHLHLLISDSAFLDTVTVAMQQPSARRRTSLPPQQFKLADAISGSLVSPENSLTLLPSVYISKISDTPYVMIRQQGGVAVKVPLQPGFDSITHRQQFKLNFPRQQGSTYTLWLPDSLFLDVFGRWNDSSSLKMQVLANEESGNLIFHFALAETQPQTTYIIILKQPGGPAYQRFIKGNTATTYWQQLLPGRYDVTVIEDANGNGRWDTGDYWEGRQPERIFHFPKAVIIRANWDVEVTLAASNERSENVDR
ncbi:MAG: Ig-like domain-containing protein [Chitinophagales bacterium]|nr:Ig-like domain-containing protein [Chitinophagales bacterium]MDW8428432.1 Ig-like domain-containing protein [Chitinophagales bacterium]